mmetsp:Transcript_23083/g.64530  ORF Transcript_23083/g.64530 Transcript_23083/m.64530 type:complete len:213 (-) Transcript_23083:492-1130(-)
MSRSFKSCFLVSFRLAMLSTRRSDARLSSWYLSTSATRSGCMLDLLTKMPFSSCVINTPISARGAPSFSLRDTMSSRMVSGLRMSTLLSFLMRRSSTLKSRHKATTCGSAFSSATKGFAGATTWPSSATPAALASPLGMPGRTAPIVMPAMPAMLGIPATPPIIIGLAIIIGFSMEFARFPIIMAFGSILPAMPPITPAPMPAMPAMPPVII